MKLMQKWQLEVCKMFLYMAFPVAMFHYFNSPQLFEEAVTKVKLQTFPTITEEERKKVEDMIMQVNLKQEERRLKELAAKTN